MIKENFRNWSIIQVNYKSHTFIAWQLKILYEFNNPNEFELIIVDNSVDKEEYQKLLYISKPFKEKYQNIKIIEHTPINTTSSGQHGEAIEIAKKNINSKFTLIHDPDFFWLKKNYLNYLEKLMDGKDAVGAPYPRQVAIGQEYFPSAFGCAYLTEKIINTSFEAYYENDVGKSWELYYKSDYCKKNYDFYYDVGWKIREKLSKEDDSNFITFHQINIFDKLNTLLKSDQKYSYETNTRLYLWNSKIIGAHLFRGTHTGEVSNHKDPNAKISNLKTELREMIGELMYNQIRNDCIDIKKLFTLSNRNDYNSNLILKITIYEFLLFNLIIFILKLKKIPIRTNFLKKIRSSIEVKINNINL